MLDPKPELASDQVPIFDAITSTNESYDSWEPLSFGHRVKKTAQNYESYRNLYGDGVQFRPQNLDDESGVSSPPLWKTSPPKSPIHPRHQPNNYRSLSPTSRAQAIARGQWELMEMVKNMPESCYELSLKDIVEHHRLDQVSREQDDQCLIKEQSTFSPNNSHQALHQRVKVKRQESNRNERKAKMMRSGSMDNRGLFLKMVFPISWGSKKKKNSGINSTTCAKISPRPELLEKGSSRGGEKDWWKKRFNASSESDSGMTSSNCGSTGSSGSSSSSRSNSSRKNSGLFASCWTKISFSKRKSAG